MASSKRYFTIVISTILIVFGIFTLNQDSKIGSKCSEEGYFSLVGNSKLVCFRIGRDLILLDAKLVQNNKKKNLNHISHSYNQSGEKVLSELTELKSQAYEPKDLSELPDVYRCFLIDPKISRDLNVDFISMSPSNSRIAHHASLIAVSGVTKNEIQNLDAQSKEPGWPCFGDSGLNALSNTQMHEQYLQLWAPGTVFNELPVNTSFRLRKGSFFILVSHVFDAQNGDYEQFKIRYRDEDSKSTTNLENLTVIAPIELPCLEKESGPLCNKEAAQLDLRKKYGDSHLVANINLQRKCPITEEMLESQEMSCFMEANSKMLIVSIQPHMHLLGRKFSFSLISRKHRTETNLTSRDPWSFHNQTIDWYSSPILINKGDILKISCSYDRKLLRAVPTYSLDNARYITYGPGSTDEMCQAFLNVIKIE